MAVRANADTDSKGKLVGGVRAGGRRKTEDGVIEASNHAAYYHSSTAVGSRVYMYVCIYSVQMYGYVYIFFSSS